MMSGGWIGSDISLINVIYRRFIMFIMEYILK